MRKFLLLVVALLTAGVASAQPIGVKVVKDESTGRLLVRADDGTWLAIYGSGAPSFSTFLAENVPAGALYFNTANGASYGRVSGSWAGSTVTTVTPATTTVGSSTNCFMYADGSSVLQCDSGAVYNNSGAGNGVFTVLKTPSGGSTTSNFLNVTGTQTSTLTAQFAGSLFDTTSAGSSAQTVIGTLTRLLAGYTGSASTRAISATNSVAGTGTSFFGGAGGGNTAINGLANATTTGSNSGITASASGGDISVGGYFSATTNKNSAVNAGIVVQAVNGGTSPTHVAGYFGLTAQATPTWISSVLQLNNGAIAAPIIVAQDNGAALPTSGPTATWQVMDGAWPQLGNGVLTSATMTAETQARQSGSLIHSYTWTNAQVVALGAALTGDIKVATLPAKTVVKNAYVVITGQGAGVTTLTVAFGRVSAGYIDYIVASDAKAAANTVYGDASGERGTNLTGYDLPSYTATTDVYCHFISTGANLDQVTGSTGRVIIETALVP